MKTHKFKVIEKVGSIEQQNVDVNTAISWFSAYHFVELYDLGKYYAIYLEINEDYYQDYLEKVKQRKGNESGLPKVLDKLGDLKFDSGNVQPYQITPKGIKIVAQPGLPNVYAKSIKHDITEKQYNYLHSLMSQRTVKGLPALEDITSKKEASKWISKLINEGVHKTRKAGY